MGRIFVCSLLVWLCACGPASPSPTPTEPGALGCEPDAIETGAGDCLAPGVAECAEGFEADEVGGCRVILPAVPCGQGRMATAGELECRPVADCGPSPRVTTATQHVAADYAGGDSDGSAARPWASIQAAIDHAGAGGHVFVGPGLYPESLTVTAPTIIEGACPDEVVIEGQSANAVKIAASEVTLRGVSVTGPERGIWVHGGAGIVIDQVRVFDTTVGGILVGDAPGTAATLRDSLVETPGDFGIWLGGSALTVERSVIRGARGLTPGRGLFAHHGPNTSAPNELRIERSIFEDHANSAITFSCGEAAIEATVLRGSHGLGAMGAGLATAECLLPDWPTSVTLRGSVIEDNRSHGVMLYGVDAALEDTTIRHSRPNEQGGGHGVQVSQGFTTLRVGEVSLSRSVVDDSAESAVAVFGASLTADRLVLRGTVVTEAYPYGHGLLLQSGEQGQRAHAAVTGARIEDNAGIGALLLSADASLDRVAITNELPVDAAPTQTGVLATYVPWDSYPSQLQVRDSDVSGSVFFGIYVLNSEARVQGSRIRDIRTAQTGRYGDGITVASGAGVPEASRGSLVLEDSIVERAHRAGLASFGGDVLYVGNELRCNPVPVNGETDVVAGAHQGFELEDGGGNRCGCGESMGACEVLSQTLEPLEPLPGLMLDPPSP